ncbi:phenylalanine--tRNA ligase subunit beta [uncultured Duncaniella sp.]|jgi:phenylalanyl-tRNA synthetase beta chain|uniref:phenylalanine--tRNA ligase subunit beta n=1 Tax=uncultured Duncaniella sp. TaxID=2768039 RepID=UPI000F472F68|nr:phenylalanine--tRNA ligase subunit beta [uncultured Duncaniella sp.]ROS89251.1 phenylalanine--tRNA ligase subunit beta [Muribaculaceae bacterium Isolate-080 (Janvier)]
MNISYNWLKKYLDFNLSPDELAAALTSIGLETGSVEEVESIRGGLRGIVIGKVLTCVEHPNSDHLHITTVDLGDGAETQIVCGAPNVAAGQTVVVATVGTTLYDGDKEFAIKKSKIRGVESFGMICAEDEIGVGTSHDGIIVIADDVKPGTPAAEFYGLTSDYVLEVDLTPNRIDAASHYGVARDLAAWMSAHTEAGNLHRPEVGAFAIDTPEGGITVDVENTDACPRYTGVTVRGVTVKESPKWLKDALSTIGLRPINNIVDITNYLLHGMGQPLHCFDVAKIAGNKIVVKNAKEGEKFVTLDGVEHTLDSRDLMICNTEVPMCIAGVFGGLDSGVTEATTDVFLESAYFNPTSVRKTARRHGLNTDSSFRFERGVDPNNTLYVLKLAALMVKELAGGEICGPLCDNYPSRIEPAEVSLSFEYFDKLIGKHIPADTIVSILKSLEMELTEVTDEKADMKVPTYRVDVTRPCDVAEDVLRIYGYNNVEISSSVRSALSSQSFEDQDNKLRNLISEQLTAEGFNEILNNSLTAEAYYTDLAAYPADHCVRLLNPLSNDLNVMRQTLLFGGLESLSHNINRKMADLAMYEFGNVYFFNPAVEATAEKVLAPYSEASRLAIWLTGALRPGNWARPEQPATVYDMKAVITNILNRLGINPAEIKLAASSCALYSAALDINTRSGKNLGSLGVISKKLASKFDIKQEVIYCELDWHALVNLSLRKKVSYSPLAKTMPVKRDLALLLDKNVTLDQVEAIVRESERRLLKSVTLFDVYEGKNLPEGKKSYAIAITLQDDEKTLQDKQIEAVMNKVIGNLTKKLGAELR